MANLWCAAVLGLSLCGADPAHTKDSLADVRREVDAKRAVLIDVRELNEWNEGHVQGAIHLPLSAIKRGLTADELRSVPVDKVLYLHCRSGKRCLAAAAALNNGKFDLRPLQPGYDDLIVAGFLAEKSPPPQR